ncbi:hypothetical protein [Longispora urticae]
MIDYWGRPRDLTSSDSDADSVDAAHEGGGETIRDPDHAPLIS